MFFIFVLFFSHCMIVSADFTQTACWNDLSIELKKTVIDIIVKDDTNVERADKLQATRALALISMINRDHISFNYPIIAWKQDVLKLRLKVIGRNITHNEKGWVDK